MTPDGTDTPERIGFTGGYGATFTVKNTGSDADTYTLLCLGSANVTCTSMWPNRLNLNPGQSRQVAVTYDVGAPGWGQIRLSACNPNDWCDLGHYDVPVVGVAGAPIVALRNHNGDHLDRSLCLTSGAGEAAAWQCGDLLVAHSMPGYATLNRERSLTLLYNSAQASPRVRMAAAVTEGGDVAPPQSVVAELRVNGILRASATYSGWGSSTTAETRQIVLAFDASADSTGVHPFTLTLRNQYSGAAYDTTLSGTLIVVNRGTSEFGQGWWLAGVEQLVTVQPSPAILWIGGDGSAKVYAPAGTNTWVAPLGAFRDTLRFDPGTGLYTRTLRHGVRVRFDGAGRHVETVNRAGQKTTFTWAGSPARLTSIQVPPAGVSGTVYTLAYAGGYLDRITDPAGRELDATVTSQRLAALLDPDGYGPGFGYDSGGRMIERTTRRGFQTRFVYGHDLRVTQVRVPLDTASGDTAVTAFQAWDEKALHIGMGGSGLTAIDTALTYTRILGPRVGVADSATFWIDRWGAPTKIVDHSIGATTTIGRSDSTVPALVTDVRYPTDQGSANGRIVKMAWDARANLIEMRDSTSHLGQAGMPTAVTRWTYEDPNTPDSPDSAIDPEDVITRFAYNSMGLTREITAPNGHVTEFEYHTAGSLKGHLRAVVEKDVRVFASASNPDSVADLRTSFAQNALGNDTSMTSPMGHTTAVRARLRAAGEGPARSAEPPD